MKYKEGWIPEVPCPVCLCACEQPAFSMRLSLLCQKGVLADKQSSSQGPATTAAPWCGDLLNVLS